MERFLSENYDSAMSIRLGIAGDLAALIREAPAAVDSFSPGHWTLMLDLERRAREVVGTQDVGRFIEFLCDTAFLKQPYRINREDVRRSLTRYPAELARSLDALQRVDALDYQAMDCLAALPWFAISLDESDLYIQLANAIAQQPPIADHGGMEKRSASLGRKS
jgi:hypothetical protein